MAPVLIEGMPAAYVSCTVICTGATSLAPVHPPPPPPVPPPLIVSGSATVLINGRPAARWVPSGDMAACGVFLGDLKLAATRTVFIGGPSVTPPGPMPLKGPRASQKVAVPGEASLPHPAMAKKRVDYPVPGLFDSIGKALVLPEGWRALSPIIKTHDNPAYEGAKQHTLVFRDVNGAKGKIQRTYDAKNKKLILEEAFLDKMPSWSSEGVPMVDGKGTPMVTYLSIWQMKKLGVRFGELKSVKMSTIQNVEAVMQLHVAMKEAGVTSMDAALAQKTEDALVAKTHSVQYARTTIEQSGHSIAAVRIDKSNGGKASLAYLMDAQKWPPERQTAMLNKYGLKATDQVLYDYDIHIDVVPHPAIATG
jgi:uncharacterized Zn-binding protein involved in type VI secretion